MPWAEGLVSGRAKFQATPVQSLRCESSLLRASPAALPRTGNSAQNAAVVSVAVGEEGRVPLPGWGAPVASPHEYVHIELTQHNKHQRLQALLYGFLALLWVGSRAWVYKQQAERGRPSPSYYQGCVGGCLFRYERAAPPPNQGTLLCSLQSVCASFPTPSPLRHTLKATQDAWKIVCG